MRVGVTKALSWGPLVPEEQEPTATVPEEGSLEARGLHTALCSQIPVVPNLRPSVPSCPVLLYCIPALLRAS